MMSSRACSTSPGTLVLDWLRNSKVFRTLPVPLFINLKLLQVKNKELLIRMKLEYDDEFAIKCLLLLYQRQIPEEQEQYDAIVQNNRGFNKQDAGSLSMIVDAVHHCDKHQLSYAELGLQTFETIHQKLPKYSKQLSSILTDDEIE